MKEKTTALTSIGIIVAVVVTLAFYAEGVADIGSYLMIFIMLVILLAAAWLVRDRLKNMRKGLPAKDERQEKINYRAGYYSWLVAIWSAVGTMWVSIFLEEEFGFPPMGANHVVAAVVLASGLCFFAAYFLLGRKGDI